MNEYQPTLLDLFSGIGGFSLGFEAEGFRTVAFAELDPEASIVLNHLWPDVPNLGDVRGVTRATVGQVDVIAGGVPCQPASLIGNRRGSADERWLWPDAIRITGELRPRFALFENPRAILTVGGGREFNGIVSGLAEIGYDCWWQPVPAYAIGAGHRRDRVFILASDADSARLERYAWNGEVSRRQGSHRPVAPPNLCTRRLTERRWYLESGIKPVVDGLPGRVAKAALRCVGNSVVPQVVQVYAKVIRSAIERDLKKISSQCLYKGIDSQAEKVQNSQK